MASPSIFLSYIFLSGGRNDDQGPTFFDYGVPPNERQERIDKFRWLANRTFDLDKFLKGTEFSPADTLTINTLVTAIPWDLVPYEDNYLGHLVSVGLKIPTLRHSHPFSGAGGGRPRFLHIVANPAGDLLHAAEEVRELQALLGEVRGVDYEPVTNPTPGELINRFSARRSTPFLHFTGHVLPKKGLVLKDGILSIEHIVRYFPSEREQFVLLNGCDAVYEGEAGLESEAPDLFQSASVANAFLDAGAEAVIAPRSRIADEEARHAAAQIWRMIFAGDELGAIVRNFRSATVQANPSAISGYSYVLYGAPSSRLRIPPSAPTLVVGKAAEKEAEDAAVLRHEILREAWGDAGGPVAPRHIFAALTRRWVVGQIFFGIENQTYFLALERLRRELGAKSPPPPPAAALIEFTDAESLTPLLASGRSGLVAATESYVTQRFVAGEDLRLDALRDFLNERALDRVDPLQRDHELAFGIGLAGTVLGLGVQLFLAGLQSESSAQVSVFSQTFLTGVVLKASSTFVGILVAAYARSLRWSLLEGYDRLVAQLEEFVGFRIAPLFTAVRAERGDLGETLRGVIEELKNTVGHIEIHLRTALYEAVERASEALGEKLKQTFASELAESIQEQITKPFRTEVDRLKEAITRTGDAISENARGLRDGAREFQKEFSETVRASFTISKELQDASHVLERVAQKFEEVVEQAERVSTTLRASEGEVARAIQQSRGQDDNHYPDIPAITDLTEIARLLREATQNMDHQLASMAQLNDRLDGPRPVRRQGGER